MAKDYERMIACGEVSFKKGAIMKGRAIKILASFICFNFFFLQSWLLGAPCEAAGRGFPIGEMVSRGEVKFEVRDKVWKRVENSHFPVFKGVKIRTEKGVAAIALKNNNQIEMDQKSLISFESPDQLSFSQGRIDFRTPSAATLSLKVGGLIVTSSRPLQAAKGSLPGIPVSGEAIGTLSRSPDGALTVKSHQGPIYILNQERIVLASLSSRESVTLPSVTVKSPPRVMVAQVGEAGGYYEDEDKLELLGLTVNDWLHYFAGWAAIGGLFVWSLHDSDDDHIPVCP
jgi:hypothetical protein